MSVRQHHNAEAAVRQHAQVACVAAPRTAMDDKALAAIVRDLEAQAVVHIKSERLTNICGAVSWVEASADNRSPPRSAIGSR